MTNAPENTATPEPDALTLVKALKEAIGGITHHSEMDHYYPTCDPKEKPHGRLAYSLHFTNRGCVGTYIDVSVMPRLSLHNTKEDDEGDLF